jgi:site-specific DNA-methyltransferase (adenine-specific)
VDAVVCDPPYSSGGAFRGDRMASTTTKYRSYGAAERLSDFTGDNRDQRSFGYWSALWLAECLRVTEPGGVACVFSDWRQPPTVTDALQAGGWVWQGIVVWDKANARPRRGGFRAQAEYVVWGSAGPLRSDHEIYLPGVIRHPPVPEAERVHLAEKPLAVLGTLVEVAPKGSVVLDPFCGSATTLLAATIHERRSVGIEVSETIARIASSRLAQGSLFAAGAGVS